MRKSEPKAKAKKAKSNPKSKSGGKDWALKLIHDVWPDERDFMERPDRYRYVRKLLPDSGACVFCESAKVGVSSKSLVLAMDQHCLIIMNKYPYNTGHLLILPRQHVGELTELGDVVLAEVAKWQKKCVYILRTALSCHGFNLGLNLGAVSGAGLPGHLHWHVVPRWGGDTNFFPLIGQTKALPETLEQTYSRLEEHFRS